MPSSQPDFLTTICSEIMQSGARSLLDIGIGNGKFGYLAREYLDVYQGVPATDKRSRIDGIEIHKPYITPGIKLIYNNIYMGNVLEVLGTFDVGYDLVICADMLEHLDENQGHILLDLIQRKARRAAWITTPVKWTPSAAHFGNKHERHRSLWAAENLSAWGKVETSKNKHLLRMDLK